MLTSRMLSAPSASKTWWRCASMRTEPTDSRRASVSSPSVRRSVHDNVWINYPKRSCMDRRPSLPSHLNKRSIRYIQFCPYLVRCCLVHTSRTIDCLNKHTVQRWESVCNNKTHSLYQKVLNNLSPTYGLTGTIPTFRIEQLAEYGKATSMFIQDVNAVELMTFSCYVTFVNTSDIVKFLFLKIYFSLKRNQRADRRDNRVHQEVLARLHLEFHL